VSPPHDRPDARELLEAVREFLAGEVEPELEGRLRYLLKVAINVLAIAERELELGGEQATRHAARLARLGFDSDAELARAIRAGAADDRLERLEAELKELVADKLAVARPTYHRR
jgi:hypothetical protein